MRIAHLCLSCFYIDNFAYQENELVKQNLKDGHEVLVIASTENYNLDGQLIYSEPKTYQGAEGATVIRLDYDGPFPASIKRKLRIHSKTWKFLSDFQPDLILFHGACGWELNTAGRYVRENPNVTLFVDSHEDFMNSAVTWVSKWLLHWAYYRPILRRNLRYITKILPVAVSSIEFLRDFYGVPEEMLEFYPLGGFVPDDEEYARMRNAGRSTLSVGPDEILIVQSGKLDRTKKLCEALEAFGQTPDAKLRFVIAGKLLPDIEEAVREHMSKDARIAFIGWQSPDELRTLLCAADIYCQPGTQSATMQMGVANRCAVILDDVPSHAPYIDGNGWLVGQERNLGEIFAAISADKKAIESMQARSHEVALRLLDYRLLAKRLYRCGDPPQAPSK